jgi:hypothetical protein
MWFWRGTGFAIGLRRGRGIERCLKRGRKRVGIGLGRPGPPCRRHIARAQFPRYFLPYGQIATGLRQIQFVQHQTSSLDPLVVTADAVLIDQRPRG